MNATRERQEWTARVAVRVPRDDGDELRTNARRRLEASRCVDAVEDVRLCGLEPALSATIVRAEARFASTKATESATVADRLTEAPGVERVEAVRRA